MGGAAAGTHLSAPADAPASVSLRQACAVWARIGLLSFGGPAGQIALMHSELVERRRWLSETRFLHALNYCMLLPGPEAQQLAIYIGWLLHRTVGGVMAGVLFLLPGLLAILVLAVLYASHGQAPPVAALFSGLKAAILAVVLKALLGMGRRSLRDPAAVFLAAAAFLALFALQLPFPVVIATAAGLGLLLRWLRPQHSASPAIAGQPAIEPTDCVVDTLLAQGRLPHVVPSARRAVWIAVCWLAIWWLPVLAVLVTFGADSVLGQQGLFFSQAAVLTFGGAYAVLAYVGQRMVEGFGWLLPGQVVDGLALAETTPGPLILVLPFLAFLAGFGHETALPPMAAGLAAALLATWATFVPCFLWIFLGAPWIEALRGNRALNAALSAVTAAVVGVIANLALWFALHVLFGQLQTWSWGPIRLDLPVAASLDIAAAAIALGAAVALLRFRVSLLPTLALAAAAGVGAHLAGL